MAGQHLDADPGSHVFKQVDEPGVEIEVNSTVAGWDDHTLFDQRIRNYTKKPIEVEIRRTFPGHIVFRSGLVPRTSTTRRSSTTPR